MQRYKVINSVGHLETRDNQLPYEASPVDANGVDRSLIRWYLTLTPSERLRHAIKTATQLERLKLHRPRT